MTPPRPTLGSRTRPSSSGRPRRCALAAAAALAACDGALGAAPDAGPAPDAPPGIPACPELPVGGLLGVFRLPSGLPRYVRVQLTEPTAIGEALVRWQARPSRALPLGRLRCRAPVAWNCGWRWHLAPDSAQVVEMAIELCDAAAPVTDAECEKLVAMTDGFWCPWQAELVELRDCRNDPGCPLVAP